jgi:methylphosphotriester-DNA--protein-cysteine methyltransferase
MTNQPDKTYKLINADGESYASAMKGTLGGHRKSRIYGTLDCKGAASWIAKGHYVKNRVFFADEATAIAAGFRPCANCLPEKFKQWKKNSPQMHTDKHG